MPLPGQGQARDDTPHCRTPDHVRPMPLPGQGQAQPVPYTNQASVPYRVRAGLAPALVVYHIKSG